MNGNLNQTNCSDLGNDTADKDLFFSRTPVAQAWPDEVKKFRKMNKLALDSSGFFFIQT